MMVSGKKGLYEFGMPSQERIMFEMNIYANHIL
jgi:hypothetical protein